MRSSARVVIVGGGMMGCGLLYHLAEEGWTDSLLIEKGELTSGSTWHAAGQCPSFIGDFNMAKVHHYGNTLYPTLEAKTGQYVSWHGCGGIRLATTQAEVDFFHHVATFARNIGFHCEIVDVEKIKQLNPLLTLDGVLAGAWTLDDGHVDPAGCCNALAKGARDMGAEISRRNRVLDIRRRPGGDWEVESEQGTVVCEHVVNAAGCYAREVSKMVGADTPISNMEHHYVVTEPLQAFLEREEEMQVIRDPYPSSYYRQEQKGALIGIYEWEAQEAWTERGGFPEWESENELFTENIDRIAPHLERVYERIPVFAEAGIRRIVNGAIPHTSDGNPLLGPIGGVENFWQCCGSSIGIAQGGGCGKYLAQWIVHGDSEINMAGVDPRRYGPFADEVWTRKKSYQDYAHMYVLHLPGEQRPEGRPARTSPLYETLAGKGGVHTEAFGWERPLWFSTDGREEDCGFRHNNVFDLVAEECKAAMEGVALMDLSSFAKFDVSGPDAEAFLNRLFANRMPRKVGGIVLAHRLNDLGRIQSEATITRLGEERFYLLSGAAWEIRDYDALIQGKLEGERVEISNITDGYGNLVLIGPKSRDVLRKLTNTDLSNESFRWLSAQEIDVAGVPLRALRVNYAGELGWELHAPMDRLAELYAALMSAGEEFAVRDFGAYALDSLRLEKGYRGIGAELTNEITLIEADMERFLKLDKGDFVGREATAKAKEAGAWIKLVYCEVEPADCDSHGGETVLDGERAIGVTTSGGFGHRTGKSICFAYVEPGYSAPGTSFEVEILGQRRKATVLEAPLYDPENERLRA